jgi:hypothetical protein
MARMSVPALAQCSNIAYLWINQRQQGNARGGPITILETPGIVLFANGDDAMARYVPLTYDSAIAGPGRITEPRRSLLRRFFDALIEARQYQAEREVARFLATRRPFAQAITRAAAPRARG